LSNEHELTDLLRDWSNGNKKALEQLAPHVHRELHRLASLYLAGERSDHPLQTTALINEAYVRLIGWKNVNWQNRAHFFAMAAHLMRRILVDIARARRQAKRGAGMVETTLNEACVFRSERSRDLVLLDEALTRLAEIDPRKSRIIEMRFFGGLSVEETAELLKLSHRTIRREWSSARAWLYRELTGGDPAQRNSNDVI
jgi:RNA polymerase sigma factor (TIGR02999 family)